MFMLPEMLHTIRRILDIGPLGQEHAGVDISRWLPVISPEPIDKGG